jgi:hypothetical protein
MRRRRFWCRSSRRFMRRCRVLVRSCARMRRSRFRGRRRSSRCLIVSRRCGVFRRGWPRRTCRSRCSLFIRVTRRTRDVVVGWRRGVLRSGRPSCVWPRCSLFVGSTRRTRHIVVRRRRSGMGVVCWLRSTGSLRLCRVRGRWFIRRSDGLRGYYPVTAKHAGPCSRSNCRLSVIHRRQQLPVAGRRSFVLGLFRRRFDMALMRRRLFGRRSMGLDSTLAAIESDMVVVDDHRFVVDVGHVDRGHIVHATVVIERSASPVASLVPDAAVPEAIVDASIEANRRPPVAGVPGIDSASPTPISGCPK